MHEHTPEQLRARADELDEQAQSLKREADELLHVAESVRIEADELEYELRERANEH